MRNNWNWKYHLLRIKKTHLHNSQEFWESKAEKSRSSKSSILYHKIVTAYATKRRWFATFNKNRISFVLCRRRNWFNAFWKPYLCRRWLETIHGYYSSLSLNVLTIVEESNRKLIFSGNILQLRKKLLCSSHQKMWKILYKQIVNSFYEIFFIKIIWLYTRQFYCKVIDIIETAFEAVTRKIINRYFTF